jgi:hypothetical protein
VQNSANLTVATAVKSLRSYDVDNNGVIGSEELRRAILELDLNLTDKQIQNIAIASDIDGDGNMDYDEAGQALRTILDIQQHQLTTRDHATSVAVALFSTTALVCFFGAHFVGLKVASKDAGVVYGGQDIATFGDGIYFVVVSLTTVGLGDMYPAIAGAQTTRQAVIASRTEQNAFWWLLIFGMGSLASFIASVQTLVYGLALHKSLDEQFASLTKSEKGMA